MCVTSYIVSQIILMCGWSVWASHKGDLHWVTCLIKGGVILPSSVKQDGWLREYVCVFLKSDNIWSGDASQPPFKVEISPQVTKLLCFWHLPIFGYFSLVFDRVKLDFSFPCAFDIFLVFLLNHLDNSL